MNLIVAWFYKLKYRLFGWLIFGMSRKVRELSKSLKLAEQKREESEKKRHLQFVEKNEEINNLLQENSELMTQGLAWRERHDELKRQRRSEMNEWEKRLVKPLEKEISNLKEEIAAHKHRAAQLVALEIEDELQTPKNVVEALGKADAECENLFIYTDAYRAAKDCIYDDSERVFNTLLTVDQCAEIWFNQPEGSGNFEDVLRSKSLHIAPSESKGAIQSHPRIFYHRIKGDLRENQMLNHIKLGVSHNPERTMRIHYSPNRAKRMVEIGYCGGHLPL